MNELIKILCERDGISDAEARQIIRETVTAIRAAIDEGMEYHEIEELYYEYLNIEPDFMIDILAVV